MQDFRVWFTILVIGTAALLCTVGRKRLHWMADPRWWSCGEHNLFRRLVFHDNGDVRCLGVAIVYALMLALVWLFD